MGEARRCYLSYLLRLWQARTDGGLVWRASLESPHTGKRQGFADLESLFAFFSAQTRELSEREDVSANER